MQNQSSRRELLTRAGAGLTLGAVAVAGLGTSVGEAAEAAVSAQDTTQAQGTSSSSNPFTYCLNTSTIRGQKLGIVEEVELVAKAGYDGIEPWMNELERYAKEGGSLKDLGKRIADHGLKVSSAIGFAEWIVDDDARRAKGLENARRDMDTLAQIGGTGIAAPPSGAQRPDSPTIDLLKAAERYAALLELGQKMGVIPHVEVWGFSKNLSRLGQSAAVVLECRNPNGCLLADTYHLYKGGSDGIGLNYLNGRMLRHFHVNDYPADPPRDQIADRHRVFPGDGVAPLAEQYRTLRDVGFRGMLSLELFNEDYYKLDAFQVLKTGLEKTKAVVHRALV